MPLQQRVVLLAVSVGFFVIVLELLRRRRLRVEYAWLWLGVSLVLIVLTLRYDVLVWLTGVAAAVAPTPTVFLLATLLLGLLGLHYSVRLTALTGSLKELTQELALLRTFVEEAGVVLPDSAGREATGGPGEGPTRCP